MKAVNIQWDIDMEEVYERLDEMTAEAAAKSLEIPFAAYCNMHTDERHDCAYDLFSRSPESLNEFMDLPGEIEIPEGLDDEEDISDYLSDVTGFCHKGFCLVESKKESINDRIQSASTRAAESIPNFDMKSKDFEPER